MTNQAAISDAALAGQLPSAPPTGFFQQSWPADLILSSFFFVTLPVAYLVWSAPSNSLATYLLLAYLWIFGITHFVLTFTVYLNGANLRYFGRTWQNRLIYFFLPVLIFVGFDLVHAARTADAFPLLALVCLATIRLFDFNHLNRQSFGVLTLFKTREGLSYPRNLKRWEVLFFNLLTLSLLSTFLAGGVCPLLQADGPLSLAAIEPPVNFETRLSIPVLQIVTVCLLLAAGGLYVWLVAHYWRAQRAGQLSGSSRPILYLTCQGVGALLGVGSTIFYAASLALHYVEYHVLMVPRCFHLPLDESSRADRVFAWLRRSPARFYLILLGVSGVVTGMITMGGTKIDPDATFGYLSLIALFDGLFVFHYLIETFIWRFSDPYYRNQLANLYFAPKPR